MGLGKVSVGIVGTRPLLFHGFGPDSIPLERVRRSGVAGNDPTEWRRTVLATEEGQLYLLSTYIGGMLRNAARYTRKGRGSVQRDVVAAVQVLDDLILLDRFLPEERHISVMG